MQHHPRILRIFAATAAAAALTAASALTVTTASAEEPAPAELAETASGSRAVSFTLVTGDVVHATVGADGDLGALRLESADGVEEVWSTWIDGDSTYVVPADVQSLVDDGTLDRRLFDIAQLWADGYDDASTETLPVIVEYAEGAPASRSAIRGTAVTADFDAIGADAIAVSKERAAAAWASLNPAAGARSSAGVERIWLDAKVEGTALLDGLTPTVPLTGADVAHELGFDGTGVTVAVLDTGYDQEHVDFDGQVAGSASFVTNQTVQDGNGHGTHTASSVAGTGAASDGTYAGMAPGADLLIGKVLGDDGSGQSSWIMVGMQWAVDQGADVVSMSLGNSSNTVCAGPDVALVEALSDRALFVIAAGNEGLRAQVSTPGCAPSALTVGALDRDDVTAPFSSRGPSVGGTAAKPDIASQGVDVVAARTGGGADMPYVAYSGTSMATPHVAGGAALVLQAHPDLTPAEVKARLTSSASAVDEPVLEQGAGPMDVGRAVAQAVSGAPGRQLATFAYPQSGLGTKQSKVTLTNSSADDIALDLELQAFGDDGSSVPGAMFKLGTKKNAIVVPAGDSIDVPITIDPSVKLQAGDYGTVTARLIGTGADGERVTVPFSVVMEGPTAKVTVVTKDRRGASPDTISSFRVINVEDGTSGGYGVGTGSVVLTLPHGSYDFGATILTRDAPGAGSLVESVTQLYEHAVKITGDTTIVLDAQEATQLSWKAPLATEPRGFSIGYTYGLMENGGSKTGSLTTVPSYVKQLFTKKENVDDRFTFEATARLVAPGLEMTSSGGRTVDDVAVVYAPEYDGAGSAELVNVGPGTAANLAAADVEGRIVLIDGSTSVQGGNSLQWSNELSGRGAKGVIAYSSSASGRVQITGAGVTLPMATITRADADALIAELEAGPVTMTWDGSAAGSSPYVYNVATVVDGKVPSGVQRLREDDLAEVPTKYYTMAAESNTWYLDISLEMPGATSVYASGSMLPANAPLERTEYYTASPDVTWTTISRMTSNIANAASFDGPRTYEAGTTEPTSWFKTPLGASANTFGAPILNRDRNGLELTLGWWGDAAGHDSTGYIYADSRTRGVWVDGTPTTPSAGVYAVPESGAEVRVQQAFTRRLLTTQKLGAAYTTDWTFRTDRSLQGAQAVLVPSVDVDMDLTSRVLSGTDAEIVLGAVDDSTGEAADLSSVTLQYATGAQATVAAVTGWTDVAVTRGDDGTWRASVPNDVPAGTFVHLRTKMTGADGSTVQQTMIRSYEVGGRIDAKVSARSQCVNGKVAVAVHALNRSDVTADITLTTPFGSTTVADVEAGKAAYKLFDTGVQRLRDGGSAEVTAAGTVGTLAVTTEYDAAYDALRCTS